MIPSVIACECRLTFLSIQSPSSNVSTMRGCPCQNVGGTRERSSRLDIAVACLQGVTLRPELSRQIEYLLHWIR
jgi:hypothetical protein